MVEVIVTTIFLLQINLEEISIEFQQNNMFSNFNVAAETNYQNCNCNL